MASATTPQAQTQTPTAPARTSKRTRPQLVPAPQEQPSASGRKYPTLARVAVTPPTLQSAAENVATPETPDPVSGTDEAGRDAEEMMQPASAAQHGAEMGAASAPPPARVPRPTVALRRPPATKRLSAAELLTEREERLAEPAPATSIAPHSRPQPLADAELVVPVAGVHAAVATGAALMGASLLIAGQTGAFWLLALTAIVGGGGWLGYVLDTHRRTRRAASYALLASQLGALIWLLALAGPRPSVLLLAPIPLLLALRISGRTAAVTAAAGALLLYAGAAALALVGQWQPVLAATAGTPDLLDGALVSVGMAGTLAGVLAIRTRQARAEAAARARLYELRVQRARAAEVRQQVEDGAETLARALAEALRGRGIEQPQVQGALSPLADPVMAVAERMATLQQDREDRVRMDAALRTVIREVERAWLGLPWVWPRASGTALDELVALLRAPRPQDAQAVWPRETPTLLTLPTIDTAPTPRVSISAITTSTSAPDLARSHTRAPALPWDEWDEWRGWNPGAQRDGA